MAEDKIDSFFDVQRIQAEITTLSQGVGELTAKFAELVKTLSGAKSMKEVTTETTKLNTEEKQLQATTEKLNALKTEQTKALIAARQQLQEETRALNTSVRAEREKGTSMKALAAQLAKNKDEYRKLSKEQRDNDAIGGKLLRTIQAQDRELKKHDKTLGDNQRNVGNYKSAFSGISGALTKFAGVLGMTVGASAFAFKSMTDASQSFKDFFEFRIIAAKIATEQFFQIILKNDLNNLISGFKEAYSAGMRYAEMMAVIEDMRLSMEGRFAEYDKEIAYNKMMAKDRNIDIADRKKYINKVIELEEKKVIEKREVAWEAYKEEVLLIQSNVSLRGMETDDLKKMYIDRGSAQKIANAAALNDQIEANTQKLYNNRKTGISISLLDKEQYKAKISQLSKEQQMWIQYAKWENDIGDERKINYIKLYKELQDAEKEYSDSMAGTFRIRDRIMNEWKKSEKEEQKVLSDLKTAYELLTNKISDLEKKYLGIIATGKLLSEQQINELKRLKDLKREYDTLLAAQLNPETLKEGKDEELAINEKFFNDYIQKYETFRYSEEELAKDAAQKIIKINDGWFATEVLKQDWTNQKKLETLEMFYKQGLILEKDYQEAKSKLQKENTQIYIKNIEQAAAAAVQIYGNLNEIANNRAERSMQLAEAEAEAQIAGLNKQLMGEEAYSAAVDAIRTTLEEKQKAAAAEEAKRAKAYALFQAFIDAALAQLKVWTSTNTFYEKLAQSLLVGAISTTQIAAIQSQPLPGYYMGRDGGDAEFAKVSERGGEIIQNPDGSMVYVPKPSTVFLPQDAIVHPASVSKKMLKESIRLTELRELNGNVIKLISVIENKPETAFSITEKGLEKIVRKGQSVARYKGGLKS